MEYALGFSALLAVILAVFMAAGFLAEADAPADGLEAPDRPKGWGLLVLRVFLLLCAALVLVWLLVTRADRGPAVYQAVFTAIAALCGIRLGIRVGDRFGIGGAVPRIALAAAVPAIFVGGWLLWPNWLTRDACALMVSLAVLSGAGILRLRWVMAVFAAVMLYDAVMVFGTGMMQEAAGKMRDLPAVVAVPAAASLSAPQLFMLGLGDVVLPGLLVAIAFREARVRRLPSLAIGSLAGYALGLAAALAILRLTRHPQPATIYLMPGAAAGFFLAAARRGLVRALWREG